MCNFNFLFTHCAIVQVVWGQAWHLMSYLKKMHVPRFLRHLLYFLNWEQNSHCQRLMHCNDLNVHDGESFLLGWPAAQSLCDFQKGSRILRVPCNSFCTKVNHKNVSGVHLFPPETVMHCSCMALGLGVYQSLATEWQITSLPLSELGQFPPQHPPDGPN